MEAVGLRNRLSRLLPAHPTPPSMPFPERAGREASFLFLEGSKARGKRREIGGSVAPGRRSQRGGHVPGALPAGSWAPGACAEEHEALALPRF